MSRIAEALSRAGEGERATRAAPGVDHPWGDDLTPGPAEPSHRECGFEPVNRPAPATVPPEESEFVGPSGSARTRFSPVVRQRLEPLVNALLLPASRRLHAVGFSPIDGGDGLGEITAAVAELLAERTPASVCVVDTHLSAPTVQAQLGVPNGTGSAKATGVTPARRLRRNLWMIGAGVDGTNERVSSDAACVQVMKYIAQYDYVLLNIQPIAPHGEGGRFAALLDAVVLVIDAESTRRETARHVAEAWRAAGVTVLGAVMANRRFPIPDRIYRNL
jgi:Mrp family chromosome partitioning ATPase